MSVNFVLVEAAAETPQISDRMAPAAPLRGTEKSSKDRRSSPRLRVGATGILQIDRAPFEIRCIVVDASTTGALIELDPKASPSSHVAEAVPNRLTLRYESWQGGLEARCAVVWRTGGRLGVRYVRRIGR